MRKLKRTPAPAPQKQKPAALTMQEKAQIDMCEEQIRRLQAELRAVQAELQIAGANRQGIFRAVDAKYGGPGLEVFVHPDGSVTVQPKGQPAPAALPNPPPDAGG